MHSGLFSQLVKWVRQVLVESLRQVSYDFQLHSPKRCLGNRFFTWHFFSKHAISQFVKEPKMEIVGIVEYNYKFTCKLAIYLLK